MAENTRSVLRKMRKEYIGKVISDKMEKTVVVAVERLYRHPKYNKIVRGLTKLKAHDERNECHLGDKVKLIETRPLSKEKRWKVVQIAEKAKRVTDELTADNAS